MITTRETTNLQIENELKKRVRDYPFTPWGGKQNNKDDKSTDFIYSVFEFEALMNELKSRGLPQNLKNYAINRWYNYWHSVAIERAFCAMDGVEAHINKKDKLVDFSLKGINFDHKTTQFPDTWGHSFDYAVQAKPALIWWLYDNQSQARRYHQGNRLFIVLFGSDGQHWKLRSEIGVIKSSVERYVKSFNPVSLVELPFSNGKRALSDIIWIKA